MRAILDKVRLLTVLAALAVLGYVIHHVPGLEFLRFTAEVDLIREVAIGLTILSLADWAFIPVFDIDKAIKQAFSDEGTGWERAATILGWFIFLHALLGFLGTLMLGP